MVGEYVLISDDDGHWYVCPADSEREAVGALDAISRYWSKRDYTTEPPDTPDYLWGVGGSPSRVKFQQFRLEE